MEMTWIVPLIALLISVMTFIATQISIRRSADENYVKSLETRLVRCEAEMNDCQAERKRLTDENLDLMRRLMAFDRTRPG